MNPHNNYPNYTMTSYFRNALGSVLLVLWTGGNIIAQPDFTGRYFSGQGDTTYLHLLDQAYRMTRPDPVLENLSMLYHPAWNGFVEGPTWDAWWIQNSFGTSYTLMPLMDPAYRRFVENSQELWFNMIGDGVRKDKNGYCAPVGSLCDCAKPGEVYFRQGDGKHKIHDWAYGFTTAGIILQSELLLVKRDKATTDRYLPLLEKCVEFVDGRRDPDKNIFLVGSAGNLLAPSYAGSGKQLPDGSYEPAYLTEISVNYIAGLKRMIELEKMCGRGEMVKTYESRIAKVREGLKLLTAPEGYFVRAMEKDGTLHGLFGNDQYGYFESTPNHDAMAFRIADDQQAMKIYKKIKSIYGLRPYRLIVPNFPGYDDMYDDKGLFTFGRWINGGHWTTCEARMQLGYYRVGAWQDAADGFSEILKLAPVFRLDNNLTNFGSAPYQPKLPVNCVYDSWGAPGGFMRGLFEYEYLADGIRIYPHVPDGITTMVQSFPVWFGEKKIFFQVIGNGTINSVRINGKKCRDFDEKSIKLKLDAEPGTVMVSIGMGTGKADPGFSVPLQSQPVRTIRDFSTVASLLPGYKPKSGTLPSEDLLSKISNFATRLTGEGFEQTYEAAHANLIIESVGVIQERTRLKAEGKLVALPEVSQNAADQLYLDTLAKLCAGLTAHLEKKLSSENSSERRIAELFREIKQ
jgi:hypothetical protein